MKIKSTIALILTLCLLLGALSGCGSSNTGEQQDSAAERSVTETEAASGTRTITDLEGREVTIPEDVESLIAIPWPWTSIVFAVDGTDEHIASMSATAMKSYEKCMFKTLAPGLAEKDTSYIDDGTGGAFGTVNFEEMANIDPDLVLMYKAQMDTIPSYDAIDVPVAVVNYGTLEQVHKGIELLGDILHKEDRAEQIIAYHEDTEKKVAELTADCEEADKPSVLYLYNNTLMTQPVGFPGWMIEQAGGVNAAKDVQVAADATNNFATLDMETIYDMDPDVIIMSNFDPFTPEEIYNNTLAGADWSKLKAVKNHQVYKIPMGIYRWSQPNVEAHLFLEWLGKIVQPEAFKDVDLKADTEEFYKTMFDYDLSEEELNQIYKTKLNPTLSLWK